MSYLLTCVDRFTRWPWVFPIPDQTADTIARTFLLEWIARFGVPERITSDRGTNFQSNLFSSLSKFLGVEQIRTTSFHPQSNGAVERFHRHLKSALMTHLPESWLDSLPMVLLGIRSSFKQDLEASSVELSLRQHVRSFHPVPVKHHGSNPVFISKDLLQASHVFLRIDRVRKALEPPYAGSFKVLSRTDKVFKLEIKGKAVSVSIDRLKAAHSFLDCESTSSSQIPTSKSPKDVITRSGRSFRRVVQFQMPSSVPNTARNRYKSLDIFIVNFHAGQELVLSLIRQQFWIPHGKSAVKKELRNCIDCFKLVAKPVSQLMGDLPIERINPCRAFEKVGIDFAGPITTKCQHTRKANNFKSYICLFICMCTKAVHLELVSSLSAAAFLSALRRFVSRRGYPSDIYSVTTVPILLVLQLT
ncbi:transposon Ty3-I Gag-Pol polyprotein [Trichonephila clavipes]|nr:transposon Ty3-I Gag-Pol polyprotein [Trichonephila clavipes]